MESVKIKDLKRGALFTLKVIDGEPKDSQIYIRGEYDRTDKKYECTRYDDCNYWRYFNGNKLVYPL